jgi:hypothetical protein
VLHRIAFAVVSEWYQKSTEALVASGVRSSWIARSRLLRKQPLSVGNVRLTRQGVSSPPPWTSLEDGDFTFFLLLCRQSVDLGAIPPDGEVLVGRHNNHLHDPVLLHLYLCL